MRQLYGELIGIDFHVESRDFEDLYARVKKSESRIDRANRLCAQLFDMGYWEWHSKCFEIYKNENAILPFLYKFLAGYAVWLHKEHIKLQREVVKKINEVQK